MKLLEKITIIKTNSEKNSDLIKKITDKMGDLPNIMFFAFQNNTAPLQCKINLKQQKLMVEYPRFFAISYGKLIKIYAKRKNDLFPTKMFRYSFANIKEDICAPNDLNNYINSEADLKEIDEFIENNISMEAILIFNEMKILPLIRLLLKENNAKNSNINNLKHKQLYDLIKRKIPIVLNIRYIDLMLKSYVQIFEKYFEDKNDKKLETISNDKIETKEKNNEETIHYVPKKELKSI